MHIVSKRFFEQINWSTIILFVLGFWLSSSVIIDCLIVPGLSASGMMDGAVFANVGYLIFGIFNRLELLCAALVLTGCLIYNDRLELRGKWSVILAIILLIIPLISTYILTPQMSGWGLQLNQFSSSDSMPIAMITMHGIYWFLEAIKLVFASMLLRWFYRHSCYLI